ncbi:hypothetical protein IAR55_000241 [Kwoniella newhampshirensis]|uniref:Uncharacterized protein n=1 Tax=Kwoniella newhampshirensis TaxID=1651941 RepID=A0AAW0Z636_9TREE
MSSNSGQSQTSDWLAKVSEVRRDWESNGSEVVGEQAGGSVLVFDLHPERNYSESQNAAGASNPGAGSSAGAGGNPGAPSTADPRSGAPTGQYIDRVASTRSGQTQSADRTSGYAS